MIDKRRSSLSPTAVWKKTSIPNLANSSDKNCALVFVICPVKISVPTAIISAFIIATYLSIRNLVLFYQKILKINDFLQKMTA